MKLVLFVDDEKDVLINTIKFWLDISLRKKRPNVKELSAVVKKQIPNLDFHATATISEFADIVCNADYAILDGGVLRGKGDEFLDRTPNYLRNIIRQNPKTKFIISGGLPIFFYEDWLTENKDLVNLEYIDLTQMRTLIGSLVAGNS